MQAFARFPEPGELYAPYTLEDNLRRFSTLGRPGRAPVDRAFDDLIRMFYIGFTRAQHLLVLFGLGDEQGPQNVPNIATGWSRDGTSHFSRLGASLV